ncbi:ExeA family protein [Candidatus Margulisiibacteriota bacterium]
MLNIVLERMEEILENNMRDGKKTIVIIDEAHVITDPRIWEGMRLMLNFQSEQKFYLSLILLGQPELKDNLSSNKQLLQRIPVRCHLGALKENETEEYVSHRLKVAKATKDLFTLDSLKLIHESSGGIPRRINHICDLALFTGMGKGIETISTEIIRDVAEELD